MRKIVDFIIQPYPFNYKGSSLVVFLTCIFIFVFYVTYILQPYQIVSSELRMKYIYICVIRSVISISGVLLTVVLVNCADNTIKSKWKVKHELLFLYASLLFIGLGNFFIREVIYDNPNNFSLRYFKEELYNTFFTGFLVVTLIVSINFNRLFFRNQKRVKKLPMRRAQIEVSQNSRMVDIVTPLKKENFKLDTIDLLFVKSDGNYLEISLVDNLSFKKEIKRISILELKRQLSNYPHIIRSHRSYLVNLNKIEKVEGNAEGYTLILQNGDCTVPVSRGNITDFEESLHKFAEQEY